MQIWERNQSQQMLGKYFEKAAKLDPLLDTKIAQSGDNDHVESTKLKSGSSTLNTTNQKFH